MSENTTEVDGGNLEGNESEGVDFRVLPEAGPVVMDDEKFEEQQRERDDAYESEPVWKGKVLQPFAFSRKSLWYSQRLSMGAPHLLEVLGDSMAFLGDATRILYFCAHDPAEYRHLRSRPEIMQDAIDEWGDAQIENETEALQAVMVAMELYNASEVNRAETVQSGGPGRDEELGN